MKKADRSALFVLPILICLGLMIAFAGSQGGTSVAGVPLFALLVAFTFLVQWIAFIPAFILQTEKYFDLTGSVTYITIVTLAVILSGNLDGRSILIWILIVIWAIRLGTFLFSRIQKSGKDDRFDELKPSFIRFLNVWSIQGLWVTFTSTAALVGITSTIRKELDIFALLGFLIWILGFVIEVVADTQKLRFKAVKKNQGQFIHTGLWARSRHPNYLGDILLWCGIAIIILPILNGWQWIALFSPVFVTFLLTKVSGIPLLEKKADKKWGGQKDYEDYKKRTPILIPRF